MKLHTNLGSKKDFLFRYGLAVVTTSLSALLRWHLPWALSPAPYLGFYPAVVVSAALGGVGPGLVSTFGSLLLVNLVFDRFNPSNTGAIMRQVIWVVASIGVSLLAGKLAEARTRARQEAAAVRESKELLTFFTEYAPAALAMFDRNMCYLNVSQRWRDDYGIGNLDLLGKSHYEVFPELPEKWKEAHRRALNGEVLQAEADRFERANGLVQWVRWEIRPWYTSRDNIGGIVIFTEDISEKIKTDEILLRYKLIAQNSRDIVILMRHDNGRILEANAAAVNSYGYDYDELLGKTILDLRASEAEDLTTAQMEEADRHGILFETVHRRKDGSTFNVEVSSQGAQVGTSRILVSIIRDITKRKQIQEALCQQEERLRLALEAAKMAAWDWHVPSGNVIWNELHYRMMGYEPGEVQPSYQAWASRVHPDDIDTVQRLIQESMAGKTVYVAEFRAKWPDGTIRWLEARGETDYNANNEPQHQYGVMLDITERKQADEALRQSEALYRSIGESIDYGVWVCTPDGRNIYASESFLKLVGITQEQCSDFGWGEVLHPDDTERTIAAWQKCVLAGGKWDREHRFKGVDGQWHHVLARGVPVKNAQGEVTCWVGINLDINRLRQAEEELRELHAELETRVEERTTELATSLENLQKEIVQRAMAEQSLLRLNRLYAMLRETNKSIVKATNRNMLFSEFCRIAVEHGGFLLSWVGSVDEKSGELHQIAAYGTSGYLDNIRITTTDAPEGKGPTGITIRQGTYYICNDFQNDPCTSPWHVRGKLYNINSSAAVALKEGNRVIGVFTLYSEEKNYFDQQQVELLQQMGMDISYALDNLNREESRLAAEQALYLEATERLKTVEMLREKEQMLIQQSRQAAMGEMIGNIAHQWRQPLNTLGLYTQRLGLFYNSPGFNKEFLDDSITKSMGIIQHMSKTIDDFRDYFKPDKAKTHFYASHVIENTILLLEGSFQNPLIKIEFVDVDKSSIYGYQNEFAQVLLNILVNARDVIVERQINNAKVKITIFNEPDCTVVTVADNAGGIPEEIINKIFDPYFTTKGPQNGTGVGLFMSKNIIEKNMGGRLTVRNIDSGAEFRIELKYDANN